MQDVCVASIDVGPVEAQIARGQGLQIGVQRRALRRGSGQRDSEDGEEERS